MQVNQTENVPSKIHDRLEFVEMQTVEAGQPETYAARVRVPDDYAILIEQGTPVAPRFYSVDGEPLDRATIIKLQKYDVQGYPISDGIIFDDTFASFDYEEMRNEPAKQRKTTKPLALDEKEHLHVLLSIPEGASAFDPDASHLTIGEDTASIGKPVSIKKHDEMSPEEERALQAAKTGNGR